MPDFKSNFRLFVAIITLAWACVAVPLAFAALNNVEEFFNYTPRIVLLAGTIGIVIGGIGAWLYYKFGAYLFIFCSILIFLNSIYLFINNKAAEFAGWIVLFVSLIFYFLVKSNWDDLK